MFSRLIPGAALALLLVACGGAEPGPIGRLPADLHSAEAASVLQIPRKGGQAELYGVPALTSLPWEERDRLGSITSLAGTSEDHHAVYLLDAKRQLQELDLRSGRAEPVLTGIRRATVGPSGAIYAVDTAGTVLRVSRGTVSRMRGKLSSQARALVGATGGDILVPVGGNAAGMDVFTTDADPEQVALPRGPVSATEWGDLIAVGTDTGLVLYNNTGLPPFTTVDIDGGIRSVAFSPSGHRVYVIGKNASRVTIVDRFGRRVMGSISLPGPASELRSDRLGRWVLVRPQSGDSIWVIDAAADRLAGSAPGEWADDLPTVAGLSTLITRVGKDVVARNLAADGFPESGRVDGGAADLWTALAWTPKSDAAEVRESTATASGASDSAADTTAASAPTERVYLQVSSSQNGDWANQLMNQLRQAGLPASVLPPKRSDEPYRVVLGPYKSRAEAEAAAETLGRPSFILQADSTTP